MSLLMVHPASKPTPHDSVGGVEVVAAVAVLAVVVVLVGGVLLVFVLSWTYHRFKWLPINSEKRESPLTVGLHDVSYKCKRQASQ